MAPADVCRNPPGVDGVEAEAELLPLTLGEGSGAKHRGRSSRVQGGDGERCWDVESSGRRCCDCERGAAGGSASSAASQSGVKWNAAVDLITPGDGALRIF